MPDCIQKFETNIKEVKRLLEIHKGLAGGSPGRKFKVEVLHKSAIVLLVACWEAFIEDLAGDAFEAILARAEEPKAFPDDVLTLASRKVRQSADHRDVWKLAGTGWREVLKDHKTELFKEYIGKLNTPKPKQIDSLISSMVGLTNLSSNWHWHTLTAKKANQRLIELVELRGSIAHRVAASRPVQKATVFGYMLFVYRLAVISSNRVRSFVHNRTKTYPWVEYRFRTTL